MNKKTTLDDSADIYVKRESQTERQKMKDMTWKEKLTYINAYYTKKVIIGLIAFGVIFSLLYQILSPKPEEILNIAVINDSFDSAKLSAFETDLYQYFDTDKEKSSIRIDTSYYISRNNAYGNDPSSLQKLVTFVGANQLDIIIADPDEFKELMQQGYFYALEDVLPKELYDSISTDLYRGSALLDSSDENSKEYGEEADYGIRLDSNQTYKKSGTSSSSSILGILINTPHLENTIQFIEYLYK